MVFWLLFIFLQVYEGEEWSHTRLWTCLGN